MAALILPLSRTTAIQQFQRTTTWTIPTLANIGPWSMLRPKIESLLELFPPWLLAVPKKKTSHSRKRMRSANKGLKDKQNIHACDACGRPKLMHNLCHHCFSEIRRAWRGPVEEAPAKERWWNA